MRSGGGSFGHVGVHIGGDWWTFISTYDDHTPILDVTAGSMTVTFCIADRTVDDSAVEFARELASRAAEFAAELERLHAGQQHGTGGTVAGTGDGSAGEGAAA